MGIVTELKKIFTGTEDKTDYEALVAARDKTLEIQQKDIAFLKDKVEGAESAWRVIEGKLTESEKEVDSLRLQIIELKKELANAKSLLETSKQRGKPFRADQEPRPKPSPTPPRKARGKKKV